MLFFRLTKTKWQILGHSKRTNSRRQSENTGWKLQGGIHVECIFKIDKSSLNGVLWLASSSKVFSIFFGQFSFSCFASTCKVSFSCVELFTSRQMEEQTKRHRLKDKQKAFWNFSMENISVILSLTDVRYKRNYAIEKTLFSCNSCRRLTFKRWMFLFDLMKFRPSRLFVFPLHLLTPTLVSVVISSTVMYFGKLFFKDSCQFTT